MSYSNNFFESLTSLLYNEMSFICSKGFLVVTLVAIILYGYTAAIILYKRHDWGHTRVQSVCKYFFSYFRIFLFRYQIFLSSTFPISLSDFTIELLSKNLIMK